MLPAFSAPRKRKNFPAVRRGSFKSSNLRSHPAPGAKRHDDSKVERRSQEESSGIVDAVLGRGPIGFIKNGSQPAILSQSPAVELELGPHAFPKKRQARGVGNPRIQVEQGRSMLRSLEVRIGNQVLGIRRMG